MAFTRLPERGETRDIVNTFRGYNHNTKLGDGEFYEMTNMASDHYPLAAVRQSRGYYSHPDKCGGIIMKDGLCYVDGSCFVCRQERIDLGLSETTPEEPKQLISMGAYVVILPDKKYINTANLSDRGSIDVVNKTGYTVTFTPCMMDGTQITPGKIQPDEPDAPDNGMLWVDTSASPARMMRWSEVTQVWTQVTSTYVRIWSSQIGRNLQAGDSVTITGLKDAEFSYSTDYVPSETVAAQLRELEGSHVIEYCEENLIVISGFVEGMAPILNSITVSRKMPELDFVVEHQNRLWGCRYGLDAGGEFVNILYASKLGNFKSWDCYQGIASDSYFANVGSDGPFTGAISYGDTVVFSKENVLHVVYGDTPSSFLVQKLDCKGVQKGSGRSMAIVGGVLYYKSATGVCAYDGSLPVDVGYCLGGVSYHNAAAGSWGGKYYISMQEFKTGEYHLFAYDTERGLWHREDNARASVFASDVEVGYFLEAQGENAGAIRTIIAAEGTTDEVVSWSAQTGIIGADHPDRKHLKSLNIRLGMEIGSRVRVLARYDSAGQWQQVGSLVGQSLRAVPFPVRVRRCDHLELRLEGTGPCKIHAIVKSYEIGSDRR